VRVQGGAPGTYERRAAAATSALLRSELCGDARVHWTPSRNNELTSNATRMGWIAPGLQHTAVMSRACLLCCQAHLLLTC
jgi:hypothetical protein